MKLYAHPDKYLTKKILIAAAFAELDVELPKGSGAEEGRIPVLETDKGCIFSTNAIARYVSRLRRDIGLYGQNLLESGAIDSWVDFCTHELEVPLGAWLQQASIPKEVVEKAKGDVQKALTVLDNHLLHFTFMAGDTVTLADISIVAALNHGMKSVLDTKFMAAFSNLRRWYGLITGQPQVAKVLGKADAPAAAPGAAKGGKADKPGAKEAAPKAAAKEDKKAAPKAAPAASGGAVDEEAVKKCGDDIKALKEQLKGQGLTGKKLNEHPEVAALVAKLTDLKAGKGAAPAAAKASPKQAAKGAPASSGGAVDEEAIKAVGDEIRVLKEKLKGQGITGKKLNDHPEVATLVAKLADLKAGKPAGAPAAKGAGSPKGGPAMDAEALKKLKKAVIKEGGKRGVEIEGAADMGGLQFFCTNVETPDGDVELLVECMNAMNAKSDPTDEERKGGSGAIGKMIFSAGTEQLAVAAYVPEAKQGDLSCEEWLKKVLSTFNGKLLKGDKTVSTGVVKADGDKGIFPLKIREPMILEANNFLRKLGLFPVDNGSSDEMVFGDEDFPSM